MEFFYATINKYLVKVEEFTWSYDTISTFIYDLFVGSRLHLWYLYMCVGLYMITPIIRPITESKMVTKYYIILIIGILIPIQFIISLGNDFFSYNHITNRVNKFIQKFMFIDFQYTSYYILGYYLSKIIIKNNIKLYLIYFVGLVSLYGTYIIKITLSYKYEKEINRYTENNHSLNVVMTTISIFIFFKHTINKLLEKLLSRIKNFKIVLKTLSDFSLGCYLIHVVYIDLFKRLNFKFYLEHTYISIPLYSIFI